MRYKYIPYCFSISRENKKHRPFVCARLCFYRHRAMLSVADYVRAHCVGKDRGTESRRICLRPNECSSSNVPRAMPNVSAASMDQKFVNNFCATHNSDPFVIRVAASPMWMGKKFENFLARLCFCPIRIYAMLFVYYFWEAKSLPCIRLMWVGSGIYKVVSNCIRNYTHSPILRTLCFMFRAPRHVVVRRSLLSFPFLLFSCVWFRLFQVRLIDSFNCSFLIVSYFTFPLRSYCFRRNNFCSLFCASSMDILYCI